MTKKNLLLALALVAGALVAFCAVPAPACSDFDDGAVFSLRRNVVVQPFVQRQVVVQPFVQRQVIVQRQRVFAQPFVQRQFVRQRFVVNRAVVVPQRQRFFSLQFGGF